MILWMVYEFSVNVRTKWLFLSFFGIFPSKDFFGRNNWILPINFWHRVILEMFCLFHGIHSRSHNLLILIVFVSLDPS